MEILKISIQALYATSSILLTFISSTPTLYASDVFYNTSKFPEFNQSDILLPMGSFLLPGMGQWTSGQYVYASAYSAAAVGGILYSKNSNLDISEKSYQEEENENGLASKNTAYRKMVLGLQTYQAVGGLSLYHSFRTAANLRKDNSKQYEFLEKSDTPAEILSAPFQFKFLKNTSTWLPLSIEALAGTWLANHPAPGWEQDKYQKDDAAFTAAFSYNAGTHEEAAFRGWMMPVLREYWLSDAGANGVQATAFAFAHLGSNPVPVTQLVLGWHLGNVTIGNHWSLQESIFIHTWWDVIAFASVYHNKRIKNRSSTNSAPASLHFPPIQIFF